MTPPNKLIVAVDLQQRSNYMVRYGTLELWMDSSFGEDGKHTNPTLAEVIGVGEGVDKELQGKTVLCHFNTFASSVVDGYLYGSHEEKDEQARSLFTIYPNQVKAFLDENGLPVPVAGNILVTRIPEEVKSVLIVPETAERHNMIWFRVEKVCDGVEYEAGDMVLCYKMSDLQMKYTINKTPVECFVVKTDDVHGYVKGAIA